MVKYSIVILSLDSHLQSNGSDINNIRPGNHFYSQQEDAKNNSVSSSSFGEDTLSNQEESDNGIENDRKKYRLNVIATENILKSNNCRIKKAKTFLPQNQAKLPLWRGESMVERNSNIGRLDSISGKELALNYLKRNKENSYPLFSCNSALTNVNSSKDFKKELISCLNIPEYFKKKNRTRAMIKRSQSLPKRVINQSISEGRQSLKLFH